MKPIDIDRALELMPEGTLRQVRVLLAVCALGRCRQNALVAATKLPKPATTRACIALAQNGFIDRETPGKGDMDGRAMFFSATPKGVKFALAVHGASASKGAAL